MIALRLLPYASLVLAQGYVHLDVGRRTTSIRNNNRLSRRQNGDSPLNAAIYQDPDMLEYIINVTIGTPGQNLGVTLDTGSSDLWIPTTQMCQSVQCDLGSFDASASSSLNVLLEGEFNITYAGPGDSDAGDWVTDTVAVGGTKAITDQIFGAALAGADQHGVLGLGYDTNEAEPNPGQNNVYKNVVDNMVEQKIIARRAYSIYLNSLNETAGNILFGGIDSTKYTGPLVVLPLQTSPETDQISEFYVTLTQVVFTDAAGKASTLTPADYSQSVLLDTGTSSTLLDADTASLLALGLGAVDMGQETYLVPCQYAQSNATVSYTFGGQDGVTITVPVSELIGGKYANQCLLGVAPPLGGAAIMGDTFLRSAYVVLDLDNNLAALAQAVDNRASTSNIVAIPAGTTFPGASVTASASGTQLEGAQASATGSVPLVASQHGSYPVGTPTFALGNDATSGATSAAEKAQRIPGAVILGFILTMTVLIARV